MGSFTKERTHRPRPVGPLARLPALYLPGATPIGPSFAGPCSLIGVRLVAGPAAHPARAVGPQPHRSIGWQLRIDCHRAAGCRCRVPINGSAVQVWLDGHLVFQKGKGTGRRFAAQQSGGYVSSSAPSGRDLGARYYRDVPKSTWRLFKVRSSL